MKPVVVIHIDSLRREYVSNWLLGQRFKSAGYRVVLTSRSSITYLLKAYTPEVIILSHVFAVSSAALTNLIKRNVKIYINEVEGVIEDEAGIASTYPSGYVDYSSLAGIFVWSSWSRDWLIKHRNVNPLCVHAVGSIRNSILATRVKPKPVPVVGVLSRFELINTFDGRHNFENLLVIDPENEALRWYYDRWAIDAEAFSIVAKMIGVLTAKGVLVSMRPHPNENLASYRLLKQKFGSLFSIDESFDLSEWLSKVSVVVGPTSTAYTEAYLAKIPVVSTQGIQRCQYTGAERIKIINEFARAAHMPVTVENAIALCEDPSLEPIDSPALNDYFKKFYSIGKSSDSIDEIVSLVVKQAAPSSFPRWKSRRLLGPVLKYLIDVAVVFKAVLRRHPARALSAVRQYNYCAVLHRPSRYMEALASERRK